MTTIYLVVAVGGAIGAVARLAVATVVRRLAGPDFPWGTLAVNLTGSFLLGLLVALLVSRSLHNPDLFRYGLGVGFLGAYTTFSTFELEGHDLMASGKSAWSLLYLVGSVVAGFIAIKLGLMLGRG